MAVRLTAVARLIDATFGRYSSTQFTDCSEKNLDVLLAVPLAVLVAVLLAVLHLPKFSKMFQMRPGRRELKVCA